MIYAYAAELLLLASVTTASPSFPPEVTACLEYLGGSRERMSADRIEECTRILRDQTAEGDRRVWGKLRGIVTNERVDVRLRLESLRIACEKADAEISSEILALGTTWVNDIDSTRIDSAELSASKTASDTCTLLSGFVLENMGELDTSGSNAETALNFLASVETRAWCGFAVKQRACELIGASQAPADVRRRVVVGIIKHRKSSGAVPKALLDALDEAAFPELRSLVFGASKPEGFHFGAATALAHFGDREIVAHLEACRPAFLSHHARRAGALEHFLWQIDVQNPPSNLAAYIAGPPEPGVIRRLWALERGVEVGLSKTALRQALLAHATQITVNRHGFRAGLAGLKGLGQRLGVLRDSDWPDIKVPTVTPTP